MTDKEIDIISYGHYIPWHSLKRQESAEAWQSAGTWEAMESVMELKLPSFADKLWPRIFPLEEMFRAGQMAYQEVGIENPQQGISVAKVHDCFRITEMTADDDSGFGPRGQQGRILNKRNFALKGELPVNPHGGLKCFGPSTGAGGLSNVILSVRVAGGGGEAPATKKPDSGGNTQSGRHSWGRHSRRNHRRQLIKNWDSLRGKEIWRWQR